MRAQTTSLLALLRCTCRFLGCGRTSASTNDAGRSAQCYGPRSQRAASTGTGSRECDHKQRDFVNCPA